MQVSVLVIMVTLRMSSGYHLAFYVPFEYKNYNRDETKNGNRYPHALTIAIDDVNNNPNILPGHNLTYSWTDSTESNVVLRTMYEKYIQSNRSKPVDAFIGPAFHCAAPAKVAKAFDIPMISYLCLEDGLFHKRDYPLFIRTYQNTNSQATSALLALLQELQWKQIGIIYENVTRWKDLKKAIEKDGEEMDLEITQDVLPAVDLFDHYAGYADRYYKPAMIRNESLQRTRNVLTKMAKEKAIKIFVIVTSHDVLMDVMAEVNNLGLAGSKKPHRAFIGFQLDVTKSRPDYARKNEMFYNKNILDRNDELKRRRLTRNAARSLLIISCAEPKNGERYDRFKKELTNRAKSAEPFNTSADASGRSDVAPALYDAVYQYALALDRLHKRNARISAQAVVDEFRSHSYISMGGFTSVFLPESGDLKVHFRLLHLDYAITQKTPKTQPTKIANFTYNKTSAIEIRLGKINWPWGTENPSDQANCKDDNYDCPKNFVKHTFLQVVLIVLSVVLCVIFIILVTFITRQWRREQELKRSIWQIDIVDIVFDRKVSTDSKFSDDSGVRSFHEMELDFLLPRDKQGSYNDSELPDLTEETTEYPMRSFSAIRNMTGNFKGDRVFVKIFPKNVDISQSLQKELRMLGSKGTLEEVLANQDVTLNYSFVLSLVYDIAKGMTFLHKSDIKSHGNLKSSNCVIDNRWVLKITDYGIPEIRSRQLRFTNPQDEDKKFKDLLWRAPELLRQTDPSPRGTQKGDVYSFAIVLEEFHTLKSPYSNSHIPTREIIDRIVDAEVPPYRPVVIEPIENAESLLGLMKECWKETPEERPSFDDVKYEVENQMIRSGLKTDICDNMIMLLENYSNDLENVVSERTSQLRDEKHKTDALLDRMLPRPVAEQLKKGENVQAESFSSVTIYFSDIVQFTALCAESTPMEVVDLLNDLYLLFDDIIMDYSVYKVETIGDAYMVVSGLPMRNGKLHASEICCMALEILDNVVNFKVKHKPDHELQVRIGIHTGPVVAGVVGMTMPRYCLFGDTVNTASRMESNGEALRIHISESTKNILEELGGFHVRQRPEQVYLKGKGNCTTYWLQGASPDVPRCPRKLSKKALKPLFQNPNSRKMSAPFRSRKKTQTSIPRASIA